LRKGAELPELKHFDGLSFSPSSAMKILVVDDSRAMRALIRRALVGERLAGAEIHEAANGRDALACIRRTVPDLVLANWNMPEMSGIELLETLHAAGVRVRFGFITSDESEANRARAVAAGASFLLAKPFTHLALEHAVDEATAEQAEAAPH
jgi:two-component system chemotaxis response regulator CheY